MKKTSMIAFTKILRELTPREMQVYDKIRTFPGITIRETAIKLKTFPHAISGRFTGLEKKGVIKTNECKYFKGESQPHSKYVLVNK
jgi:DNA-binding MarR family transcriptional regulator